MDLGHFDACAHVLPTEPPGSQTTAVTLHMQTHTAHPIRCSNSATPTSSSVLGSPERAWIPKAAGDPEVAWLHPAPRIAHLSPHFHKAVFTELAAT